MLEKRRVLRRNADLQTQIRPIEITEEMHDLFEHHKRRFKSGVPNSVYDFILRNAATAPTQGFEVTVLSDKKLLAASFFDVGDTSISSIYAIFDPEETKRSFWMEGTRCFTRRAKRDSSSVGQP